MPCRSISHQQSARALEDITDLRIPEEFLPIDATEQITVPPSPPIFKNWVVSQITHARDLFQKQNYMQALMVIDKAKEHGYMREFVTDRSLAPYQTLHHLQDLYLVEYCCRLVCAHEAQLDNVDILETLRYLNTSVLQQIRSVQAPKQSDHKTTFRLYQDPLIDYTLAILTRSWALISLEDEAFMSSRSASSSPSSYSQKLSADRAALASAALPFLKAIVVRRLFPSNTSMLQDMTTTHGSSFNLRTAILEMCLSADNQMSAMQWIWLWERRDRKDWLDLWSQLEMRHWLAARFLQSSRPDWTMDLFRLVGRASRTPHFWLQDLLGTISHMELSSSWSSSVDSPLKMILRLSEVDINTFDKKKQYYKMEDRKRLEHLESWLAGLQDINVMHVHRSFRHLSVEQQLWREMAMVGVLSNALSSEDITHSIGADILAVVDPSTFPVLHNYMEDFPPAASSPAHYHDTLTEYLEDRLARGVGNEPTSISFGEGVQKASILLHRIIQGLMSHYRPDDASSQQLVNIYRKFLHDLSHHAAFRLGHLGLISHVAEIKFRALYGDHVWKKTVSIRAKATCGRQGDETWKSLKMTSIPEAQEFMAHHMRSRLGRMCARKVEVSGSPLTRWEGRLSGWFMALAETHVTAGRMARNLNGFSQLVPGVHAYDEALSTLLEDGELEMAAALHSHGHRLFDDARVERGASSDFALNEKISETGELGRLIHALATSDQDPKHLELAQWIFDQHLNKERAVWLDSERVLGGKLCEQPQVLDIRMVTDLIGAWSRRAEFSQARHLVEAMWAQGMEPNMVFYNTLLKSLVDLTPYAQQGIGRRTMGGGKQSGMREIGREMMVRQLITSRDLFHNIDDGSGSSSNRSITRANMGDGGSLDDAAMADRLRSKLDDGWDLFQNVIRKASELSSENSSKSTIELPVNGLDASVMVKSLIAQTGSSSSLSSSFASSSDVFESVPSTESQAGQFRPDAYTFSILLGVYARRGEIESIPELFVEMKSLGLEPDIVICRLLANAFAKRRDLKALDRVIQEARARQLEPGLYCMNMVLDCLVEMEVSASKIREALDRMVEGVLWEDVAGEPEELDLQLDLDEETEIPVRRFGVGPHRSYPHSPPSRQGQQTNTEKQRNGTSPLRAMTDSSSPARLSPSSSSNTAANQGVNAVTMTTLIKFHTRKGDLRSAQDLLQLMAQVGFVPDRRAYILLLGASIRKQDVATGLETIRAMRTLSKELPDAKAWKGLLRVAMEMETSRKLLMSQTKQQQQKPVIHVLKELAVVLDEIERTRKNAVVLATGPLGSTAAKETGRGGTDRAEGKDGVRHSTRDYLREVLTSSWISTSSSSQSLENNNQVKGRNGLLRRLLNHLLREPYVMSDIPEGRQSQEEEVLRTCAGTHVDPGLVADRTEESRDEIKQRCKQAIWLVRLVEDSGIGLGSRWKLDVVVPMIQALTGQQDPDAIVRQLSGGRRGRRRPSRKSTTRRKSCSEGSKKS
ncbi:hypothetical protein EDD11_004413 [Mortierella claussenii]|nr:hypothetical protein EDD11_004413 [Mortierella claussenii]